MQSVVCALKYCKISCTPLDIAECLQGEDALGWLSWDCEVLSLVTDQTYTEYKEI